MTPKQLFVDAAVVVGSQQVSREIGLTKFPGEQTIGVFCRFVKGSLTDIQAKIQIANNNDHVGGQWHDCGGPLSAGASTGALTTDKYIFLSAVAVGAKKARLVYTATGSAAGSSFGADVGYFDDHGSNRGGGPQRLPK